MQLPTNERSELTLQMAGLLFPKLGLEIAGKSDLDLRKHFACPLLDLERGMGVRIVTSFAVDVRVITD